MSDDATIYFSAMLFAAKNRILEVPDFGYLVCEYEGRAPEARLNEQLIRELSQRYRVELADRWKDAYLMERVEFNVWIALAFGPPAIVAVFSPVGIGLGVAIFLFSCACYGIIKWEPHPKRFRAVAERLKLLAGDPSL